MTREIALGPSASLPRRSFVVVPIVPPLPLEDGTRARSALVGFWGGKLRAYANLCRHLAIPLDYGDGEVMDPDGEELMCHHHGASFDPLTGMCTMGPCFGDALFPIEIREADGQAVLVLPA